MGVPPAALPYLGPGGAHLHEALVHHAQQGKEGLVLIVKAGAKNHRADDVGDGAAEEERGVKGETWQRQPGEPLGATATVPCSPLPRRG